MNNSPEKINVKRLLEWIAALIGAVNCMIVPGAFFQSGQTDFPFPFLYFVEIALLGVLVIGFVAARRCLDTRWNAFPWLVAGILLAFVILGGFSIGPFLIPAFLAFTIVGLIVDAQTHGSISKHVGLLFVAAVAQGALMVLMLSISSNF